MALKNQFLTRKLVHIEFSLKLARHSKVVLWKTKPRTNGNPNTKVIKMNPNDSCRPDELQQLALDLFELAVELSDMALAKTVISRIMSLPND